jgi:NAD(P)-dependent dehydrogenase (short-subunit alcohol dehydrogenase family)
MDSDVSTQQQTPPGLAAPIELAGIYVLLASDEASYMSGGAHAVTGGHPIL